jgi:hypothetical protein
VVGTKKKPRPFPIQHSETADNLPGGHLYAITFASPPDAEARALVAAAFERAVADEDRLFEPEANEPWRWRDSVAIFDLVEGPDVGDFIDTGGMSHFFAAVERVLVAIHAVTPLRGAAAEDARHGTVDDDFERARQAESAAIARALSEGAPPRHTKRTRADRATLPVVLAPEIRRRPPLPAELEARFPYLPATACTPDGTWILLAPDPADPRVSCLVHVVDAGGSVRTSPAIRSHAKSPFVKPSPDASTALVLSRHLDALWVGPWRPFLYELRVADASLTPLGEPQRASDNGLCDAAYVGPGRLAIATECGIMLVDRADPTLEPIGFVSCEGASGIAATDDGRRLLVTYSTGKVRGRLFEVRDDALVAVGDIPVSGWPFARGERLFVQEFLRNDTRRTWELR